MTVLVTQAAVHGTGNAPSADDDLTAYAHLHNGGESTARVSVVFSIDSQAYEATEHEIPPGGEEWASREVGRLGEGGHELSVTADVDDGSSNSQSQNGISFMVSAGAPPADPTASLTEMVVRAHSNVQHQPGHAWEGEHLGVWLMLTNTGIVETTATVAIDNGAGVSVPQQVHLAPGAQTWVQQAFDPLPAGNYTVTASASAEGHDSSILLGHATATLTVALAAADFRTCNVQLTVHNYLGNPMSGRMVLFQFIGMDGNQSGGGEGTLTSGGTVTQPQLPIPTRGTLRVIAVSTGEADVPVDSTGRYHLADGQTELGFTVVQDHVDQTIKSRDLNGVRNQLSSEAHAGLEFEVLSVGGSVASEAEQSRQHETEVDWTVRVARQTFTITPDAG